MQAAYMEFGGLNDALAGGAGALTVSSSGTVNVTAVTTLWAPAPSGMSNITVNGGTFTTGSLISSGGAGTINLQADPAAGHALLINGGGGPWTYSGSISGGGSVLKSGTSTQIFSGSANTYSG